MTRGRDIGLTKVGAGNQTSFAPRWHGESGPLVDPRSLVRLAALADRPDEFVQVFESLDHLADDTHREVVLAAYANGNFDDEAIGRLIDHWRTGNLLDAKIITRRTSAERHVRSVLEHLGDAGQAQITDLPHLQSIVAHPSVTDELKIEWARGDNRLLLEVLAESPRSPVEVLTILTSNPAAGSRIDAAVAAHPSCPGGLRLRLRLRGRFAPRISHP